MHTAEYMPGVFICTHTYLSICCVQALAQLAEEKSRLLAQTSAESSRADAALLALKTAETEIDILKEETKGLATVCVSMCI